jgi:hypothetical protein
LLKNKSEYDGFSRRHGVEERVPPPRVDEFGAIGRDSGKRVDDENASRYKVMDVT